MATAGGALSPAGDLSEVPARHDSSFGDDEREGSGTFAIVRGEDDGIDAVVTFASATVPAPPPVPPMTSELEVTSAVEMHFDVASRLHGLEARAGSLAVDSPDAARTQKALRNLCGVLEVVETTWLVDMSSSSHGAPVADMAIFEAMHGWVGMILGELEDLVEVVEAGGDPWGIAGRAFAAGSRLHIAVYVEPYFTPAASASGITRLRDAVGHVHDALTA